MNKSTKLFSYSCICTIIFCISDIFCIYFQKLPGLQGYLGTQISNIFFYTFSLFIFICYLFYIISFYKVNNMEVHNAYIVISMIASFFFLLFLFLTPKFGFYFSVDENNIYHRGKLFFLSILIESVFYIEVFCIIYNNHRKISFSQNITFLSFIIFPSITWIIQILFYGISLNSVGISLSFLVVFINLNKRLEENISDKSKMILEKEKAIIKIQDNTIISLSNLVENRDSDTGHHVKRTSKYVELLALKLKEDGYFKNILTDSYINLLIKAAPMHDIGKIVVPDTILKKPGKLTPEEFEQMKSHTKEGGKIVRSLLGISQDPEYIQVAVDISTCHHEKWNGEGYPYHLSENNIPLSARIMAIADVFDALVSKRCYKQSMSPDEAFEIIEKESGTHFDPILVKEFLSLKEKLIYIMERYND